MFARFALAALLLALSACHLYAAEDCPGENPGSCSSWSQCVTTPGDPGFGQCGGEVYVCEGGEWVVDGWCEPLQTCEEPPPPGCPDLAACGAGECLDLPLWECDEWTGEWVDTGIVCEGVYVSAVGEFVLEQWVFSAARECPALRPRNPLVLSAHDDGSVTAAAPVTIVEGSAGGGFSQAYVAATLTDDWYGITPTLAYEIWIGEDGAAAGQATSSTPCEALVEVRGTRCPVGVEPCGVFEDGWNLQCWSGAVYSDDLARYSFCPPGSTVPACEVGGEGGLTRVATCSGECADTDVHWFATFDEYATFDPVTLCAP